jgi:hypothetical protein
MANLKKTLASGAELEATLGSFEECERLDEAVKAELGSLNFDNESLVGLFMRLSSSKAVKNALWPLLGRATYNGQKITKDTFESAKERADFFPVAQEVLVFNLRPFVQNLGSQFAGIFPKDTSSPK